MIYKFEDFSLDADRRELRRGSDLVIVEPQVFDLLQYLIRNRDRIVSKDDLIAGVWDGRIVSDSTLSSRLTAVRQAIGDSGEGQRLIRTVPRKGFRFIGAVQHASEVHKESVANSVQSAEREEPAQPKSEGRPPLPDKPSIAVLPFVNMSGDSEQEYFADGITEDLITAISQFRWLFVIARNSSFVFKGKAVDAKQIAQELGVRYLLEGSVRKAANRVRITAQLIDAITGAHLWANHFDGDLENIFELQDQVTASVIGAIAPKLEQAEIERSKHKPTENLDAYDHYLRGVANAIFYTKEGDAEALRHFYKAIELDPEFAAAYGLAAWCFVNRKSNGWMVDRAREIAEATRLGRRAVELGREDAGALCWGGFTLAYVAHELDNGIAYVDRALVLNPNLAAAWYLSGWLRIYLGEPEDGIERLMRALRLSPLDALIFRMHAGISYGHFFAGRYDEASAWAKKAVRDRPIWLTAVRGAVVSHALAGRLEEARKWMAHMRQLDPTLRISNLKELLPLRRPEDFARWSDALRKAGLPE